MSDLVERLPIIYPAEAAAVWEDEIERLRVENADLKRLSDSLRALSNALRDERDELRAKVERLRAERDDWKQCTETTKKFTDVKIERLRATLEIIVRHNENMSDWPHTIRGAQQVARAALEQSDADGQSSNGKFFPLASIAHQLSFITEEQIANATDEQLERLGALSAGLDDMLWCEWKKRLKGGGSLRGD